MKKIYLAIPYSKVDKERSFEIANRVTAKLTMDGHAVFSPITQGHSIVKENKVPTDWKFWEKFDRQFIEWCDEINVVTMAGWIDSTGVQAEIKIAESLGKKVVFLNTHGEIIPCQ